MIGRMGWLCTLLLLVITGARAQQDDALEPLAVFDTAEFHEVFYAGDTLYASTDDAVFTYNAGVDDAPVRWREMTERTELAHITPDGASLLLFAFIDLTQFAIIRVNLADDTETRLEINNGEAVPYTGFSRDGRFAAVLLPDYLADRVDLRVYDLTTGDMLWTARVNPNIGFVNWVEISPDNRFVTIYGESTLNPIWDVATGEQAGLLQRRDDFLQSIQFSPDGASIYASTLANLLIYALSDAGEWEQTAAYPIDRLVTHLVLSGDGATLLGVLYPEGAALRWGVEDDSTTLTPLAPLVAPESDYAIRIATSEDGEHIATIDAQGVLRVWQVTGAAAAR